MEEIDSQEYPQQPKKDIEGQFWIIAGAIVLLIFGLGTCAHIVWTKMTGTHPIKQPVESKKVYVHDTVCVKDTTQVQYLKGQLALQKNKVVRLQKELEICNGNYHVITIWK